jgi:CHAT domain-containing protein/Tfp pilus assembly protein PilF
MIRITAPIVLVACYLALLISVSAQAPSVATSSPIVDETTRRNANDVLAHARELYATEGPKAALPEYEKALTLFRKDNDKKGEAITLGLIGNCYKKFGDFPKAEDYLQRALAMKREIHDRLEEGKTLSHLGLLHWEMADYKLAVEYLNGAIKIGTEVQDHKLEGSARNNLGLVFDELGEYRKSLEQYEQALKLYRGTNFEQGISDTLANMGGLPLLLGEYAKALGYYQQALEIDERNNLKPGICLDLQNIGLALAGLGRLPEALQSFDRSIKLAVDAGLKKEEADSRRGKGSTLFQLGKYDQARAEFRHALEVYEQAGLKQQLTDALTDLGNLDLRLGDAPSAERSYRRSVEIAREIKHPRGVTYGLITLGDIEWRRKRFNEAVALYKEALARATEVNDRSAIASAHLQLASTYRELKRFADASAEIKAALEIARSTEARAVEAEALYVQGDLSRLSGNADEALKQVEAGEQVANQLASPELSWRLAFARGQVLELLQRNEEALAAYQRAVKTIEAVRSELREERFRAGYVEDKYQVYVALVELLLKIGKTDEAFLFSEKLRARSYLDLLNRSQPPMRNEAQRQKETLLRNRVRELQRKLEEESSKPPPNRRGDAFELFSQELAIAERDYQTFLDDLFSDDPAYASIRALKVPDVNEVRQRLPADAALIEYVVGRDSLQIFVVTSTGLHAKSVSVSAGELQTKVEFVRDVMMRKGTNEWKPPAASLYQTLIAPVLDAGWLRGITRIYIVPHAALHYLPFATLVKGGSLSVRGSSDRLLIDDYVLAYLPAAAALVYGSQSNAVSKSALAMAPSNTGLRYTQRESRDVSAFFPARHMLLLGPGATETSFKRFAGTYDVIHLATHGYFNKLNPLLSGVTLEADSENDGRLEVHEILGLRLNAKLVTLSACDTALGSGYFAEVPAGDDLVGLTRAFLFAGSPSVLASLWEVNDLSAVQFMRRFYQQMGHTDKAVGLANVQREMSRRGGIYRHPYYWSGFVMIGQMK